MPTETFASTFSYVYSVADDTQNCQSCSTIIDLTSTSHISHHHLWCIAFGLGGFYNWEHCIQNICSVLYKCSTVPFLDKCSPLMTVNCRVLQAFLQLYPLRVLATLVANADRRSQIMGLTMKNLPYG